VLAVLEEARKIADQIGMTRAGGCFSEPPMPFRIEKCGVLRSSSSAFALAKAASYREM
jgi:hypothetical protein